MTREARETLSGRSLSKATALHDLKPEKRLQAVVESLCDRLSRKSDWIARLAARELVDRVKANPDSVGVGLREDLLLIQATIRDLFGPRADRDAIRLHALSVVAQCVFCCLVREKLPRFFPQFRQVYLDRQILVRHVVRFLLDALAHGPTGQGRQKLASADRRIRCHHPRSGMVKTR